MLQLLIKPLLGVAGDMVKGVIETKKAKSEAKLTEIKAATALKEQQKLKRTLPPTEIISHNEFFDYNAKYKGQSDEITPAELDESKIKEVKSLAIKIYQKLNLRGFTRSDFILKNNKFYFLEVNTNPGLTKESILPQQAKAAGININKLFESVLK